MLTKRLHLIERKSEKQKQKDMKRPQRGAYQSDDAFKAAEVKGCTHPRLRKNSTANVRRSLVTFSPAAD